MRNSTTVGEDYRYCAGHLQVYSPVVRIEIEDDRVSDRHFMRFEILLDRVPNQRQAVENALGLTHHAVLALSRGSFGAREVWFTHEPPLSRSDERRVGKSVSVRVDPGGRRIIYKKQQYKKHDR